MCRSAVGKAWGLSSQLVHWILTSGLAVWWTVVTKTTNCLKLDMVVKHFANGISGSIKFTTTEALFAVLGIHSSSVYAKYVAALTALRLMPIGGIEIMDL